MNREFCGPASRANCRIAFEERQSFDVANRAADFDDDNVRAALLADFANAVLDLVGYVGNDLDGFAEIIAAALLFDDAGVDLAAGEVVEAGEFGVREPLVMPEIEIGFRAVVGHVHLAVLEGVHGAGVNVQVRVEFGEGDLEAAVFQERAERGRRKAFAERTDNAAGDKDVFHA